MVLAAAAVVESDMAAELAVLLEEVAVPDMEAVEEVLVVVLSLDWPADSAVWWSVLMPVPVDTVDASVPLATLTPWLLSLCG